MEYPSGHYLYSVFHIIIIFMNLFGWMHRLTRKLAFVTILITWASWIIGGIFYGWGYCFLTELHYELLNDHGITGMPSSFIEYFFHEIGISGISSMLIQSLTFLIFLISTIMAALIYFKDKKKYD